MINEEKVAELERRTERVLAVTYRGIHHVPYWNRRRKIGSHSLKVSVLSGLSTWDYDELTRLVIAAHDECVRLEIHSSAPRMLRLSFSLREREGNITERHPTIEQAIERIRA